MVDRRPDGTWIEQQELDMAAAILRIEQIASLEIKDDFRELLISRLASCDVPRLRRHLKPEVLDLIANIQGKINERQT